MKITLMDNQKLTQALASIAANPAWKDAFIKHILNFEKDVATPGVDVREDISGPLVDALFDDDQVVRKQIADGTVFEFLYRSKIARDFIMSEPSVPDHAWEPHTSRLLVTLAKGAKNVVVGGAYFGDQSILIAKEAAKSGGVVHAFEPNNDQRKMLMHNAELNQLSNIVPRSEGLWDNSTTTLALVGYDSFAHPETVDTAPDDAFQTVIIDEYLRATNMNHLDLIMLDIKSAEYRALKGAQSFLQQPANQAPNIVFEVHRHYVDWSNGLENTELIRFLIDLGYQVFAVRDFNSNYNLAGKPIEIIPAKDVYLEGPDHGFNMVAVKDVSVFDNPGFRICHGLSPKLLRHKDPALHHPTDGL